MSFSIILFDDFKEREHLLPLVATRPIGNLRIGALTINQKWALIMKQDVSYLTLDYLQEKFPLSISSSYSLVIKASVLPTSELVQALKSLRPNTRLIDRHGEWIAFVTSSVSKEEIIADLDSCTFEEKSYDGIFNSLKYLEDIFTYNAEQIEFDTCFFSQLRNRYAVQLLDTCGYNLYISASATIANGVHLNSTEGAIIILDNAKVDSGCIIHGPAVIGQNTRVKSGTVIYSNVTIGDQCTVGGELNNTVIWGNTAKAHYGYLGCAVIGEGCNLGAGTSNSNLLNDWSSVKVYSYVDNKNRNTELLKCGVFIGDHSMLAISSKINTGTVIGVGAQIALSNFIPKFVPDFSWLTDAKSENYIFTKFVEMMCRKAVARKEKVDECDNKILYRVYQQTEQLRNY